MESQQKPRGRPQTLDADHLLITAMQAYWHGDPADVSLNRVCGLAGVSKPFVYRIFGNEDGIQCAALDRYAALVLADVFAILGRGQSLRETLAVLVDFACDDVRMETGCLFHKMRAGQHRLGPQTRARVGELNQLAVSAFDGFLQNHLGQKPGGLPTALAAQYLVDQIGLAVTQRASGVPPQDIRPMIEWALLPVVQMDAR